MCWHLPRHVSNGTPRESFLDLVWPRRSLTVADSEKTTDIISGKNTCALDFSEADHMI